MTWLEEGDAVARVGVDVADGGDRTDDGSLPGPGADLVALVTRRSVETLGLDAGEAVVASFKATAARGVRGRCADGESA